MYYSSGNFEAFARTDKPAGIEDKSAYIVGAGLAGLAAACALVRDAQMPGDHIYILEKTDKPGGIFGGSLSDLGCVLEQGIDLHFECMWELLRSVPSLDNPDISVLDEIYRLHKNDPNNCPVRITEKCGKNANPDNKFTLSDQGVMQVLRLCLGSDEKLAGKQIGNFLGDSTFSSDFWTCWSSAFALEEESSALELKRSLKRFLPQVDSLMNFGSLRLPRLHPYESIILPIVAYLEKAGVQFLYQTPVLDVEFDLSGTRKCAKSVTLIRNGEQGSIELSEQDLLFLSPGGCMENAASGSQDAPAPFADKPQVGSGWELWKKLAVKDSSFGRPDAFCANPDKSCRVSATVTTLDDKIPAYIQKVCGKTVSGGLVTAKDSNWLLSWTFPRQPLFAAQAEGQLVGWVYGVFSDRPGNFVKKSMRECTGAEICMEWLYHIGVPEADIPELAQNCANTVPCAAPFANAIRMPYKPGDRPQVTPGGAVNFAFLGSFADTPKDAAATAEYSVRTALEAVYTLLGIERGVPEVWGGSYDLRALIQAVVLLRDERKLTDLNLGFKEKIAMKEVLKRISGTGIESALKRYHLL